MRVRLPSALLLSATAAMACQNFPSSFVPFANVASVSAPNSSGDRLVVGELVGDSNGLQAIGANLPLPTAVNDIYCNALVQLGPTSSYSNVYVPTTGERSGNFSAFAGLLIDPLTNGQPFPNGIIPTSRLGGTYAFRIGSQAPTLQCAGSSSSPKVLRVDGRAELVGDFLIVCTGGVPTPAMQTVPTVNISASLSGTITSRQLAAPNWSEALLLVDDPPSGSQIVCTAANGVCSLTGTGSGSANGPPQSPNVFQGQQTQPNMVTFSGIPFNPPGPSGSRTFRITNVKVDALGLGTGTSSPTGVSMSVTLASSSAPPFTGATQNVGSIQKALTVTSKAAQASPNGLTQFTLTYTEAFPSAFRIRSGTLFLSPDISPSPTNQDAPGQSVPGSETGFYSGFYPFLSRGNLGMAGLADNGTRLYAQLSNVPTGVTVSTNAVTNLFAGTTSSGTARLITASPSTAGAFSPLGTSATPVGLAKDSTGTVTAVFEVLNSDPLNLETVDIPFFFSYASGAPAVTSVAVTAGLAPVTSSAVTPFPRFTSPTALTITAPSASSNLQVLPQQLQFAAVQGGNTPGAQTIAVTTPGSTGQAFSTTIDGGTTGSAAPAWVSVQPINGVTPATLTVTVNPGTLAAGTFNARIHVTAASQSPVDVTVTLTVTAAAPQLAVAPSRLNYAAPFGNNSLQEQSLLVRNSGGGNVSFTATVLGKSAWIKDVTPSAGQTVPNTPVILKIHVNAQGLAIGTYTDVIRFTWAGSTTDIPIVLAVQAAGPVMKLGASGVKFEIKQGSGSSDVKSVNVINAGTSGTTVNFTATLLSGSEWAILTVPKNQATTNSPGMITLQANAAVANFPPGARTALVQVADANSQNSPQFLTAVLQVDPIGTFAPPDPAPAGILLVATAGQPLPAAPVLLNYSSTNPVPYQTSVATLSGANWLAVAPLVGMVSTAAPAHLNISTATAGMKAGIYAGSVSIYVGTAIRTVHATLVVLPSASAPAIPARRDSTTCVPQQLVLDETTLADNFVEAVGFPSFLGVLVSDDCGNAVLDATVVASFDNGDVPLQLEGDNATGFYGASWTPGHVFPGMSITFDVTNPTLLSPSTPTGQSSKIEGAVNQVAAGARLSGTVVANPNALPVLSVGGTVNNSNPVASAPLAPGTVASVYGNQMATVTQQPPGLPLSTQFQGTDIRIGNVPAPLFYVSPTQVNIQIPFELAPNQSYPVVATLNGLSSVADTVSIAPATPAVIAFSDGTAKAQHADTSFATPTNPAKPGEALAIYLVGMGVTTPAVASGAGAPFNPHPLVNSPPTLTIDGVPAPMQFPGGLVGGSVGLYQINFTVPTGARSGALDLVVTQNGFTSNVTKLIVAR